MTEPSASSTQPGSAAEHGAAPSPGVPAGGAGLTGAGLLAAEIWLEERVHAEATARLRHPRVRLWLIFMLLRHAGLRLVEILRLPAGALDFRAGLVRVTGQGDGQGREVPLAPAVAAKLGKIWASWDGRELAFPLLCDASRVRRSLRQCALACGLPPELFSARSLRRHRGLELAAAGLQPSLVDSFLGRDAAEKKSLLRFDAGSARDMLREHIQGHARTSARNHFRGRVTRLSPQGLLVDVTFATASGLELEARITSRSCRSMRLAPGSIIIGAVKALWIEARPPAGRSAAAPGTNRLQGTVQAISRDASHTEILVGLDDGAQACAIRPAAEMAWLREAGERVELVFSSAAVILNLGQA